jgi:alkanesulfonate monooxygenase SsuD/methylene tetrahydromethanopterin reductase-like flavin-dependent oxidoreductase (luciferase family)
MSADRPLLLAVDLDGAGAHPAAWRQSGRPPGAVLSAAAIRSTVTAVEAAGFTLATFNDTPVPPWADVEGSQGLDVAGRIEAGSRAAFVSTLTDRLGLAPTLHTTTTEPFHLATQLASLDHASRGRAAWVVGAANDSDARGTIGAEPLSGVALHQEVVDVVDAAKLLWDSWQDDAVIKDADTGRYLDPDRVHHIDFAGDSFTVKGPLITPRPPQGQVVVIARDDLGIDDRADLVLIGVTDSTAVAARADRAHAAAALAFVDIEVVLDGPDLSAADRADRLDECSPWPETGPLRHVGSAAELVELVRTLQGAVDGIRFLPAVHSVDLPILSTEVLPALAAAGLHRPPAPGATLRDSLGLARPANRFAAAGA